MVRPPVLAGELSLSLSYARLTASRVTTLWVKCPLSVNQHGQLSQPSLRVGYMSSNSLMMDYEGGEWGPYCCQVRGCLCAIQMDSLYFFSSRKRIKAKNVRVFFWILKKKYRKKRIEKRKT